MANSQLYDVVVYNIKTRKINTIAGKDMRYNTGFYNAEKRIETVREQLNDRYSAAIVKAGLYQKGDKLPKDAEQPTL